MKYVTNAKLFEIVLKLSMNFIIKNPVILIINRTATHILEKRLGLVC